MPRPHRGDRIFGTHRLIGPETARPLDDLPGVTLPDSDQAVPGRACWRLPSVAAARALAVPWEVSLPWEPERVSCGSCHAGRSRRSKTAHGLEPRYGIEP